MWFTFPHKRFKPAHKEVDQMTWQTVEGLALLYILWTVSWILQTMVTECGGGGGGQGGQNLPPPCTLLSHFPYLKIPAPAIFSPVPVPCKIGDSKHILVI